MACKHGNRATKGPIVAPEGLPTKLHIANYIATENTRRTSLVLNEIVRCVYKGGWVYSCTLPVAQRGLARRCCSERLYRHSGAAGSVPQR